MNKETEMLYKIIDQFISGHINADSFEEKFTEIFDFSDLTENEINLNYFQKIRELLEHYSFSEEDIKKDSQFFIDNNQLRDRIIKLKKQMTD